MISNIYLFVTPLSTRLFTQIKELVPLGSNRNQTFTIRMVLILQRNFQETKMNKIEKSNRGISSIEDALKAIKAGKFVVVMDNEDRENEGDLIMPSELATEESLAFMIRYCSGVICASIDKKCVQTLNLPMMVPNNNEARKCKFTVSVDLKEGTTTGISASDRAKTIRSLACRDTKAEDLSRPGHIFPLLAEDGGVIARSGHTEAAIDLARLAGLSSSGYLCEINDDSGKMMRRDDLKIFAAKHGLHMITISDLMRYRFRNENLVQRIDVCNSLGHITTPIGSFKQLKYKSTFSGNTYDVLVHGDLSIGTEQDMYVHIMEDGMNGYVDAQWAQFFLVKNSSSGIIIYGSDNARLVDVSGELMARQSIFGMAMQIVQNLGIKRIKVLSKESPDFDLNGFGVTIDGHQTLIDL